MLPREQRNQALRLAHDIPMAGHLGRDRTLARQCRRFWWLGITKDVTEYCKTCPECQITSKKGPKATLIPMGESFERISMDLIGPLPRTSSGKQ